MLLIGACGGKSKEEAGAAAAAAAAAGAAAAAAGTGAAAEAGAGAATAAGTGGAHGSGGGGLKVTWTGGTTSVHRPLECENPSEDPYGGSFLICDQNLIARAAQSECRSLLPRAEAAEPLVGSECVYDADCQAEANAYCQYGVCVYGGCVTDADCAETQLCFCQELIGVCVAASCRMDKDCAAGSRCTSEFQGWFAPPSPFACQRADDKCDVSSQCLPRSRCLPEPRTCVPTPG